MLEDIDPTPNYSLPFWWYFSNLRLCAAHEPGGAQGIGRFKILIVEDNLLLSMQIEDALNDAGFEVVGKAASADQAHAFAQQTHPDLMVVDIRLEGERDGISVAIDVYAELGIRSIFASSFTAADVKERGAAARPLAWISKPFDMEALIDLIRDAHPRTITGN